MTNEMHIDITVLKMLSNGEIGLRKVHKENTLPRVVECLKEYIELKNNTEPVEIYKDNWNGYEGWSCPTCGQWCYKEHNHNYCGRCGQKFIHSK